MIKSNGKRYERGYEAGYNVGYPVGRQQGISSFFQYFHGTSIIIPASNQAEALRRCLDSILANTREAYEVIVIDHGSVDGTDLYLRTLTGKIKIKRFSTPLGYAAAVNQGLRLSRGEYLLVVEPEMKAGEQWLTNVLAGYMDNWDAGHRKPAGFRILMNKEVFRRLGYLDERFEDRRQAEDEYGMRARLAEQRIDFEGDVSASYSGKWEAHEVQECTLDIKQKITGIVDFYPSHVVVRGCGDTRYWVENGVRYPIAGGEDLPSVRVSQVELRRWSMGDSLTKEEFLKKLTTFSSMPSSYGPVAEGVLVRDSRGAVYQTLKGKLRRFIGEETREAWGMAKRPVYPISDDTLKVYAAGIPIVASTVMRSGNL